MMDSLVRGWKEADAARAAQTKGLSVQDAPTVTNWKGALAGNTSPICGFPKSLTQGITQNWLLR